MNEWMQSGKGNHYGGGKGLVTIFDKTTTPVKKKSTNVLGNKKDLT